MSQEKQPTWADLKAFVNELPEESLSGVVRWWGDERGGVVTSLGKLDEPFINTEEGWEPKSSLEEIEEDATELPAGHPILYMD